MAGRHYTDREKAFVLAELESNDGAIKPTARSTGVPAPTIRRWRDEWHKVGVPESISAELEPIVSDFITDAIRVRGKLLIRLEGLVDEGKISANHVATAIGIISDKIRSYEAARETRKVEHTIALPPADELKELMSGMLSGVVEAAKQRAAEIEAVEEPVAVTTYREIPQKVES